jgi:hypothetical protein
MGKTIRKNYTSRSDTKESRRRKKYKIDQYAWHQKRTQERSNIAHDNSERVDLTNFVQQKRNVEIQIQTKNGLVPQNCVYFNHKPDNLFYFDVDEVVEKQMKRRGKVGRFKTHRN